MEESQSQTIVRWYFWLVIVVQCVIIIGLLTYLTQTDPVTESVTPIATTTIQKNASSTYLHYYEYSPGSYEFFPLDWTYPKVIERNFDITINADTLRAPTEYPAQKTDDVYRIGVLGDSWTFGLYVSDGETYAVQLEEILRANHTCPAYNQFELLNFGVPGHDLQYSAERYRLRAAEYDLDALVVFVTGHNLYTYTEAFQQTVSEIRQSATPSDGIDNRSLAHLAFKDQFSASEIRNIQFNALHNIITQADEPVMLYLLPNAFDYRSDDIALLSDQFSSVSHVHVSAAPWLDHYAYANDLHPNSFGHTVIADDLYEYLTKHVIDCVPE